MKKFLSTVLLLLVIAAIYFYRRDFVQYLMINYVYKADFEEKTSNNYERKIDFKYVQVEDRFEPRTKQDILNIIYTSLDRGYDDFAFFCAKDYTDCTKDMKELVDNNYEIANINNFVAPYNSYQRLSFTIDGYGIIRIHVEKMYTKSEISLIDQKVEQLYSELIKSNRTERENIKAIHDYIINHTVYLQEQEISDYFNRTAHPQKTNIAYGPLFNGVGICGGYTDTMALFLDRMNIPNYRVASETHIWNLVYIDGEWKHLDLTWDDPVTDTGVNVLLDTYFLIDSSILDKENRTEHKYDKSIYLEA